MWESLVGHVPLPLSVSHCVILNKCAAVTHMLSTVPPFDEGWSWGPLCWPDAGCSPWQTAGPACSPTGPCGHLAVLGRTSHSAMPINQKDDDKWYAQNLSPNSGALKLVQKYTLWNQLVHQSHGCGTLSMAVLITVNVINWFFFCGLFVSLFVFLPACMCVLWLWVTIKVSGKWHGQQWL